MHTTVTIITGIAVLAGVFFKSSSAQCDSAIAGFAKELSDALRSQLIKEDFANSATYLAATPAATDDTRFQAGGVYTVMKFKAVILDIEESQLSEQSISLVCKNANKKEVTTVWTAETGPHRLTFSADVCVSGKCKDTEYCRVVMYAFLGATKIKKAGNPFVKVIAKDFTLHREPYGFCDAEHFATIPGVKGARTEEMVKIVATKIIERIAQIAWEPLKDKFAFKTST